MTVEIIVGEDAFCVWFDEENQPTRRQFPLGTLEIEQEPDTA